MIEVSSIVFKFCSDKYIYIISTKQVNINILYRHEQNIKCDQKMNNQLANKESFFTQEDGIRINRSQHKQDRKHLTYNSCLTIFH